jgi:uncharacterized phage protein (TIGR01671 family)
MSREIKFRAWDKGAGEWLKLTFISWEVNGLLIGVNNKPWHEVELMQYTGLKDKNGVEIYEGDILDMPYHGRSDVFWRNGGLKVHGKYSVVGFPNQAHGSKVIGNIYENPELLEVQS